MYIVKILMSVNIVENLVNIFKEDNMKYLDSFKYKTLEKFFKKLLQNT